MKPATCETCPFWRRIENAEETGADGTQGECRIDPPVIVARLNVLYAKTIAYQTNEPLDGTEDWMLNCGRWPRTRLDDWCGKHPFPTAIATYLRESEHE